MNKVFYNVSTIFIWEKLYKANKDLLVFEN